MPAAHGPATAADLPAEVLPGVLALLDHDSLFCALQVCRAWRAAAAAPELWERLCAARGWAEASEQQQEQHAQQQQAQQQAQQQEAAPANWRQRYRQRYAAACFDCFRPTERHTLAVGSLRLRLCKPCSDGYDSPRPHHRLLAASTAKRQCCLRDAGAWQGVWWVLGTCTRAAASQLPP